MRVYCQDPKGTKSHMGCRLLLSYMVTPSPRASKTGIIGGGGGFVEGWNGSSDILRSRSSISCVHLPQSYQGMEPEGAARLSFIRRHLPSRLDPHCPQLVHLYVHRALRDKDHQEQTSLLGGAFPRRETWPGRHQGLMEASILALHKISNTLILTENIKPNIILVVLNRREQQPQGYFVSFGSSGI